MSIISLVFLKFCLYCSFFYPDSCEAFRKRHHYQPIDYEKSMTAEEILDCPIVISLDRKPERYEFTQNLMLQAGFTNIQRFSAVDGFLIDDNFFKEMGLTQGSPGRKGCFASHLLVWKSILEGDRDYVFVLEDDVIPIQDFKNLFKYYWNKTLPNKDLIMVGNAIENIGAPIKAEPTFCMHAYILSKKGASILIEQFNHFVVSGFKEKLEALDWFTIDLMKKNKIAYCCWLRKENTYDKSFVINVNAASGLCAQNFSMPSTISKDLEYTEMLEKCE